MIKELLNEQAGELKKYIFFAVGYFVFDLLMIITINTLLTEILPGRPTFRHVSLFALTLLLDLIFYYISQGKAINLVQITVNNFRKKIIENVRNAELLSFEKVGKSEILNAVTLDTKNISEVVTVFLLATECIFLSIGSLIYLGVIAFPTFLFTLIIFVFGTLVYVYNIAYATKWIKRARIKEKELFDSIGDVIYGFKELRVNSTKNNNFFHKNIKAKTSKNREYRIMSSSALVDSNIISSTMENLIFLPVIFVIPVFFNLSDSAIIISIVIILFLPFNAIKDTIPYLIRASISVERMFEMEQRLKLLKHESVNLTPENKITKFNEIKYENISFSYIDKEDHHSFSIKDISFSISSGSILFIIGGNGSGKSTLLKTITGLYPLQSGNVLIDGSKIETEKHRGLYSIIFTDFHLFDRLYGLENVDKERVDELLRLMELEDKVQYSNKKFSTIALSTGQKKRLALIITLLEDKPVYIFDEWAADQSPQFRDYFYYKLLPEFKAKGKAVIAVTHDDHYFELADQIMKLDNGKLSDFNL